VYARFKQVTEVAVDMFSFICVFRNRQPGQPEWYDLVGVNNSCGNMLHYYILW